MSNNHQIKIKEYTYQKIIHNINNNLTTKNNSNILTVAKRQHCAKPVSHDACARKCSLK